MFKETFIMSMYNIFIFWQMNHRNKNIIIKNFLTFFNYYLSYYAKKNIINQFKTIIIYNAFQC